MNSQQAKFILQGYRPNGADAGDATFCQALEYARNDPALREWFAREQAFDGSVAAKLNGVSAPAGLREAILAGVRVTAAEVPQRLWWQKPVWLAVAASVAVIFSVTAALWPRSSLAVETLTELALLDTKHTWNHHGGHGETAGVLQAALSQPSSHVGELPPVDFDGLRKTGCRTLSFKGRDVLEVCFNRNGIWYHCYIAQRADFPALAAAAAPVFVQQGELSGMSWADAAHLYVVVSGAGRAALEKLI